MLVASVGQSKQQMTKKTTIMDIALRAKVAPSAVTRDIYHLLSAEKCNSCEKKIFESIVELVL